MIEDVSDGVSFTQKIDVYSDFNIIKAEFDKIVKDYKKNNDFKNYIISESPVHFHATSNNDSLSDYVRIDILEKQILDIK